MTKYIVRYSLGLSLLLSLNASAQQACWFEAEHVNYYQIEACIPYSDIEFYSNNGGGKMLKRATVDAMGFFSINTNEIRPAFVLNVNRRNARGVIGSGIVRFFETKEFSINEISAKTVPGNTVLSFNAQTDPSVDIYFQVWKSKDGSNFSPVGILDGNKSGVVTSYKYTDNNGDASFYKIKVINKQKGDRYTSQLLASDEGEAKVYPTASSNSIFIALDKQYANASYKIYSTDGRVVASGTLENMVNTVSIGNLSAGSYLVSVQAANKRTVSHLQKL